MRIRFLTSTPLNVTAGSGTYVGIRTLAQALREAGAEVEFIAPRAQFPIYTLSRLFYNQMLRFRHDECDVTVGFDMDGYCVAGREHAPHVASIKGVIADEMHYESGFTRWTMGVQARREAEHVRRADLVVTTSRYAALRLEELYSIPPVQSIVPELIDLSAWRALLAGNPASRDPRHFTVLCVCRFYPRKRLHLLLQAAAQLRESAPEVRVRIVGNGPEAPRLRGLWKQLDLENTVEWLGDVSQAGLAAEYNRADLFCLPSVQEGFGIVFLEAMAAGLPIVAARAAAVPEVAPHAELVEPESAESLAAAIQKLRRDPDARTRQVHSGSETVRAFDAPRVALQFLRAVTQPKSASPR